MTQSRTYNNGTILEYIYTVVPLNGQTYQQSIFIDVKTGAILDPTLLKLTFDKGSEGSFKGVCCTLIDECEGWITDGGACWVTAAGASWALP